MQDSERKLRMIFSKYFFTLMNNAASGKGHGKYGKT